MSSRPIPTPLVRSLPATIPFVPPEAMERAAGRSFRARLGANENGFGPSPRVLEAMRQAASEMWKYGDPTNHALKAALAAHYGVSPDNVAVGEGIDGLLGLTVRMFVEHGQAVVTSLGAYPTFNFHVEAHGGRLVAVPYRDDREDLEALLAAAVREKAPLVYLANPDNPMGTWWDGDEISRFADRLPAETLLILDEAYGETAPASALPPIEPAQANLLRMRTFSKAYGLAGLRLGYAIGEPGVVALYDKVRDHYGVNGMAQAAGLAALADQAHLAAVTARIAAARQRIAAVAAADGLAAIPSATNFVAVDCGRDGVFARAVMDALLADGVFVRKPVVRGLDRSIRISAAPDEELAVLEAALPRALRHAREQSGG